MLFIHCSPNYWKVNVLGLQKMLRPSPTVKGDEGVLADYQERLEKVEKLLSSIELTRQLRGMAFESEENGHSDLIKVDTSSKAIQMEAEKEEELLAEREELMKALGHFPEEDLSR